MSAKASVCVLDDDADARNSVKLLLKSKGIPFVGFGSPDEFLEGYASKNIGCLLLDVKLGKANGIDLLESFRARGIHIPVVLVTGNADVATAVRAMKHGALDVVEKPYDDSELLQKVADAIAKSDQVRKLGEARTTIEEQIKTLTRRETQVLDKIVDGKRNRTIAEELGISRKTLDIHRGNLMRKMNTKFIADLVKARLINKSDERGTIPMLDKS